MAGQDVRILASTSRALFAPLSLAVTPTSVVRAGMEGVQRGEVCVSAPPAEVRGRCTQAVGTVSVREAAAPPLGRSTRRVVQGRMVV